jgi:VIT1/CCC1 family predicted Fe2+/Mn2+ transporter
VSNEKKLRKNEEIHRSMRVGWLRAAVLGANDGIVSTASLLVGVAAARADRHTILLTGLAGLVGGAMSMAAGEYVSVSSQADTEQADLEIEKQELQNDPHYEREELAQIYMTRGLTPDLAHKVADQLMAKDALGSHARDELGLTEVGVAHPIQASIASASTFSVGAALPLSVVYFSKLEFLIQTLSVTSLLFLMLLGMVAAYAGGASPWKGALRVGFWGAFALAITAYVGSLFGVTAS